MGYVPVSTLRSEIFEIKEHVGKDDLNIIKQSL